MATSFEKPVTRCSALLVSLPQQALTAELGELQQHVQHVCPGSRTRYFQYCKVPRKRQHQSIELHPQMMKNKWWQQMQRVSVFFNARYLWRLFGVRDLDPRTIYRASHWLHRTSESDAAKWSFRRHQWLRQWRQDPTVFFRRRRVLIPLLVNFHLCMIPMPLHLFFLYNPFYTFLHLFTVLPLLLVFPFRLLLWRASYIEPPKRRSVQYADALMNYWITPSFKKYWDLTCVLSMP